METIVKESRTSGRNFTYRRPLNNKQQIKQKQLGFKEIKWK